uniref:uncharacterized protein isoform X2 n=1 Tax=Pristiophorus japonicus TaxID=55135 RepID=UPI00398F10A1
MQDLALENWQDMTMSRSASGSAPSGVRSLSQGEGDLVEDLKDLQVLPEGSYMVSGPSMRPKRPNTPVIFENMPPSPEGMRKGMEESGIEAPPKPASPSKRLQTQSHFNAEPADTGSRWHASKPEGKKMLNINTSPEVMPAEEQNTSVNSNESLLDYSCAKDESESLLKDQPKENNLRMSFSPWSKLLNMYSKMKKSPIPKLHNRENSQELLKEDGQRIQLIVYRCNESNPLIFSHFRTTDSVGFVEMEIKKMLDVQNEVRLWKKGLNDETSLLQRSDSTLKDAGILREQKQRD